MNLKIMGGMLLIAGTALGAGMLAIPMVLAQFGVLWGSILMFGIWVGTTYAALLLLEATIRSGGGIGMNTIAQKTLGKQGQLVTNGLLYCLVICLMIAYIVSAGDIVQQLLSRIGLTLSLWQCQVIFTLGIGAFIAQGTATVDKLNRVLFSAMLITLVLTLVYLLPNIELGNFDQQSNTDKVDLIKNSAVLFTSFGFMVVVPSVVKYNSEATHKQLRNMVIFGSMLPLFCYLLWLVAVVGNLPPEQLVSFASVSDLISMLSAQYANLGIVLSLFTGLAIVTSFLGVAMSLFDQNRDLFNTNKLTTFVLSFVLPLLGAILAQDKFIGVLAYAGIILVFLAIFVPMAMVIRVRSASFEQSEGALYQVAGGKAALSACFVFGGFLLFSQLI
ncbi:tyrosine transporter [Psychromonas marina]|uniref:Tyrosine transporter n=1 Tax=Psychromonas marina TaxID=88364 RepID=A0ABQ6E3S8_9GAMM|nr:aromatic amino acid transport family protein [Psychromonas marina]GLS92027.1 tyrosine transporter [Psychromonas marina]